MNKQRLTIALNENYTLVSKYGNMKVIDYNDKNFLLHFNDDMKADMIKFNIQIINASIDCIVKVDTKNGYIEFENDTPDEIVSTFCKILFKEIKK